MKDWEQQPSKHLVPWGDSIQDIRIDYLSDAIVELPVDKNPGLSEKRKEVDEDMKRNGQTNGLLLNVDQFYYKDGVFNLKLSNAYWGDYLASSFFFRKTNHNSNPICPLAVQATVMTASGKILLKRRFSGPKSQDFPGRIDLFGGSMNKEITNPQKKIIQIFNKKWGLNISEGQIRRTGADLEKVNNIVCIFYVITLTDEQYTDFYQKRKNQFLGMEEFIKSEGDPDHEIYTLIDQGSVLRFLIGEKTIHHWNPTAHTNLRYALPEQELIEESIIRTLATQPFKYP